VIWLCKSVTAPTIRRSNVLDETNGFHGPTNERLYLVSSDGVKPAAQLRKWLTRGLTFVTGLPPAKRKVARRTLKSITYQPRRIPS